MTEIKTMEDETQNQTTKETADDPAKKDYLLPGSILVSAVIIAGAWTYAAGLRVQNAPEATSNASTSGNAQKSEIKGEVLPPDGVTLPIRWDDLGMKMASVGVIDKEKFELLYAGRGGLPEEEKNLLEDAQGGYIKITERNAGFFLNLFWALGLGAKNAILEAGPMADPKYGGAKNFASTGGWTLAKGSAMDHYSRHPFIVLTPKQQALVERVSKNIYRPCCSNPTHFPDCNHGMAMLGLLELMASQGVPEEEMYKTAFRVNAYWFPDAYLTIAQYFASRDVDWNDANPKEILGVNYSSASGYRRVLSQVAAPAQRSNGGCGA